jgi:hypothetical protein
MILALVFGSIFVTVLGALASFSITQNKVQYAASGKSKGLALAGQGLNTTAGISRISQQISPTARAPQAHIPTRSMTLRVPLLVQ